MDEFINYIIKQESIKTVGILLKRIELIIAEAEKEKKEYISFKELEILKAEQKELIYEAYRNIRDFLQAGKMKIEFNNKSKE